MGDMPAAGVVVKIGEAVTPSEFSTALEMNAAGYAALTGLETIGRLQNPGALPIGDMFNTGTYATHDGRREITQKTTKRNVEWNIVCAWDVANAGQLAAIDAAATDNWYPIILERPDAGDGSPTTHYMHVLVLDAEAGEAAADAEKVDLTIRCMIMTETLVVAASASS